MPIIKFRPVFKKDRKLLFLRFSTTTFIEWLKYKINKETQQQQY